MSNKKNLSNDGKNRVSLNLGPRIDDTRYEFQGRFDVVIEGKEQDFSKNIIAWEGEFFGGIPESKLTEYRGGVEPKPGKVFYDEFCFNFYPPLKSGKDSAFAYYVKVNKDGQPVPYTGETSSNVKFFPNEGHPIPSIKGEVNFTSPRYRIKATFNIEPRPKKIN